MTMKWMIDDDGDNVVMIVVILMTINDSSNDDESDNQSDDWKSHQECLFYHALQDPTILQYEARNCLLVPVLKARRAKKAKRVDQAKTSQDQDRLPSNNLTLANQTGF